jgi:hypothetical protein
MATSGAIGQDAGPARQAPPARAVMANPAPWAVTAFATTSFMIGMYRTHMLDNRGIPIVLPAALFFGGLVQIIIAVMEFTRGNLFARFWPGTTRPATSSNPPSAARSCPSAAAGQPARAGPQPRGPPALGPHPALVGRVVRSARHSTGRRYVRPTAGFSGTAPVPSWRCGRHKFPS